MFIVVLIEGFISIGVEIFAIRQMVPYVGNNILNTSIIIGVFLLFLSLGYYKGGLIKENFEEYLLNNLINSTILISFGLSSLFLSWHFSFFENIGNLYGLILFTFLIIAPIIYLLGQTIPIITNFIKSSSNSKTNGTLLFLSTLGSFLGSIATSTLLLNFLGVNNTLFIYILILLVLILILVKHIKINKIYVIFRIVLIIIITFFVNSKTMYLYSNGYSSVKIKIDKSNVKYLDINNSFSSSYNQKIDNSSFKYILNLQEKIRNINTNEKKDILVVGAGGFTLSLKDKLNKYTYIDIDKDLKKYTEKYFLKKKINGDFIADDIRFYFSNNKIKYDIIVLDAVSNRITIPPFLLTKNFFNQVKEHLKDDGVVLINFIGSPKFEDMYTKHFHQTVSSKYNCMTEPIDFNKSLTNIIYFCVLKDDVIYTDNKINIFELVNIK